MTDNQTTELREKLAECGVKWVAYEKELRLTFKDFYETRWNANGVRWSYLEMNGKATLSPVGRVEIELTPEQAIAATLGSEREKALEELVRDLFDRGKYFNPERYGIKALTKRARNLGIEVNL